MSESTDTYTQEFRKGFGNWPNRFGKLIIRVSLLLPRVLYRAGKELLYFISLIVFVFHFLIKCYREKRKRKPGSPRLVWGVDPIISNKYWSEALKQVGFNSTTLMSNFYSINKKDDFDIYFDEILEKYSWCRYVPYMESRLKYYFIFLYCIENFDIFHTCAQGFVLRHTFLKKKEAQLLGYCQKKVVILPYGSDFYRYSVVFDISLRHALLQSYPMAATNEDVIMDQFNYWQKNADIFLPFFQTDCVGRWDLFPFSAVVINVDEWTPKRKFSQCDGINGPVRIIHTPNHRGFKGTAMIITAIEELISEGLNIEFILVEKKTNSEVKALMQEADILVEQIIATCYALSGIEGMSSGLAVLSNLESEYYTRAFRRYSYLNECPILSTTPENVKENLRLLITQPVLREDLGRAGRNFVEKYHSYSSSQYMFGKLYEKIWEEKDVDLINMYDPANRDSYNNSKPLIKHPLKENKLF